jgi:hypothetical protein
MTIRATLTGRLVTLECSGVLVDADLDPLFATFEAARRVGPFVVITDTTQMTSAPSSVLSAFSERLKRMGSLKEVWLADAVVIHSPAVRFILSTLLVLSPMPTQVKAFDERIEARRWCCSILRRAGIPIPAELLRSA